MSAVIPLSAARRSTRPRLRIGLLRLTDGAPVIAAHEFGFFADEGLETELMVEPSWANIADKLAYGFFDAAVIMPPLAFAVQLGMRGAAQPLWIPWMLSAGGNTVTLGPALARETEAHAGSTAAALASCLRARPRTLGVVHAYSTHNLLLRYWLAAAGVVPGRDVRLTVVPPAQAVEALAAGQIDGFCAGAPWGEVARRAGAGVTVATSSDIWQNAPEKAFAVRRRWAEEQPEALAGALRALLRAAKFCDEPENAAYTASLLSRARYLAVDSHAILATLPGGARPGDTCAFFRGATTFPWQSQGLWFLAEMRRWGLIDGGVDLHALIEQVYQPALYRTVLGPLHEPAPVVDRKREGAHDASWHFPASVGSIAMPPDGFCDGAVFDPDAVPAVLAADHGGTAQKISR